MRIVEHPGTVRLTRDLPDSAAARVELVPRRRYPSYIQ